jgi:hypothetical protein
MGRVGNEYAGSSGLGLAEWIPQAAGFAERVKHEQARSQRYKHFFAVLAFRCAASADVALVMSQLKCQLRLADVVGVVSDLSYEPNELRKMSSRDDSDFRVGVLLPETDGEGARAALGRALACLYGRVVGSAMAVYPDDSTDWAELLRKVSTK